MNGRKVGRPRLEIEPREVIEMATIGCTLPEMARFFRCSEDTLRNNYSTQISQGRSNLVKSLRRKQLERAMHGSDMMLIFLGKNYLAQAEKAENKNETTVQIAEFVRIHDAKPSEEDPLDV